MPPSRALRLLRPLLAPTQSRGVRGESSCASTPPPPCPPCGPAPPPPCRARPAGALPGRRVVCCPPPRGARPPCAAAPPPCPLTCDNRTTKVKTPRKEMAVECGGELDRVTQRLRDEDTQRRLQYEQEVAARRAAPAPQAPAASCALPAPATRALATDGRSYTVLSAPPPPRCGQPPSCPPPAQPVQLKPIGDCGARRPGVDPCAHRPRVLVSVDHSSGPCPPDKTNPCESPEKGPLPKKPDCKPPGSNKGLGSRIMESLGCRADGCKDAKKENAKRPSEPGWCKKLPKPAPAPPKCRPETVAERLRRSPPGPCGGSRRLHTSSCAAATERPAPAPPAREALLAAAKKLEASLKERDSLKEAGRGRVVKPASCGPPRPPPPPTTGGLEMRVPPGADTLRVRVCLDTAPAPPAPPAAGTAPPPPCGGAPPPCGGAPPQGDKDNWLSIKNLQKKLSSCGRGEPAAAPCGKAPAKPSPCAAKKPSPCASKPPEAAARPASPGLCAPRRPIKMSDLVPNTIFTKS